MSAGRVLDANINRAAEGMRVLEDISRFILENRALCSVIKNCRHQLREQTPHNLSRNTSTDVGTLISTAQENKRESIHDIATAAGNRCAEALRVIEEFLKLHGIENNIESIRYKMYDVSKEIVMSLGSTNKKQWRLCFVMTVDQCVLPWPETLMQVIEAGCDCVQIREKTMTTSGLNKHVLDVKRFTDVHHVSLIVNDRVDVMLATNATGVHLGKDDMSVTDARKLCGDKFIIGATAHLVDEIENANRYGADYVGVGAMFESPTKPEVRVVGAELLKHVGKFNHLAIGGITETNAHEIFRMGCKGIAVGSVIAQSCTPRTVTQQLLQTERQLA